MGVYARRRQGATCTWLACAGMARWRRFNGALPTRTPISIANAPGPQSAPAIDETAVPSSASPGLRTGPSPSSFLTNKAFPTQLFRQPLLAMVSTDQAQPATVSDVHIIGQVAWAAHRYWSRPSVAVADDGSTTITWSGYRHPRPPAGKQHVGSRSSCGRRRQSSWSSSSTLRSALS